LFASKNMSILRFADERSVVWGSTHNNTTLYVMRTITPSPLPLIS
jgi:hypothetical protein